jgi:hypothetical protein
MQFQRVYPQGASQPITSTLRKDERTADEIKDLSSLNTQQSVVQIGDSVPIVFCSVTGNGGVWLAPPVVRWGFATSGSRVRSCFALTLGEGQVGSISSSDIYKGEKTGTGNILDASLTFGRLGDVCSFTNSITQQFSTKLETYVVATGPSGCPVSQTTSTRAEGSGSLTYSSKTDTCSSLAGRISGTYKLQGTGNGLDGFPAYIVGKTHTSKPIEYSKLAARQFQSSPREVDVDWEQSESVELNSDYSGFAVGRRTITFHSPSRSASFIYPSNESFSSIESETAINNELSDADIEGSSNVTAVGTSVYSGTRDEKYIGSGTRLEVVEDSFQLEVDEVTRTFYPLPEPPEFNGSGGSFAGLSILNVRASSEVGSDAYLHQVYVYIRQGLQVPRLLGGTGSSSMVADLFRYLLTQNNMVPASLIDVDSLTLSAQFNQAEGLHFNGVLASATNFRDYFQRIAPFFLLTYTQTYGRPGLRPILPINETTNKLDSTPTTIRYAFTAGEIIEGSLEYQYRSLEERKPFCALMLWRQQPAAKPGYERITEVRYSGQAVDGPFEQYDLTEFCTNEAHALKVGKYLLALRRHSTHLVRFQVAGIAAVMGLRPGDYITVTDSATPSLGGVVSKTETYVLTELMEEPTGAISVTAEHSPVDSAGISLITKDILGSGFSTT